MLQRHQVYLSNYLVISGKSPREYHAVDLSSIGVVQDSQHGFMKRRSCLTNLLTFLDKVSGCLDSGENMDVVFLDFAKRLIKYHTKDWN